MQIVVPDEYKQLWVEDEDHPVVKYPDDVLRAAAQPVERANKEIRALVDRMSEILRKANGIGLAAPQVGQLVRVIIVAPHDAEIITMINPEILSEEGTVIGQEGCLSLPGLYGDVERGEAVEVRFLDLENRVFTRRFAGLTGRVVQHEVDHLDGVLFVDKADPATLHWEWPVGVAKSA